jgi:hypothetical protein
MSAESADSRRRQPRLKEGITFVLIGRIIICDTGPCLEGPGQYSRATAIFEGMVVG